MSISCHSAKGRSSAYVDGRLRLDERQCVADHLTDCQSCALYFEEITSIRRALRGLPPKQIPRRLQTSLQVIASREQAEVARSRGSRLQALWTRWKFRMGELMRPLALPATGGLLSSVLLFGTFILTIGTTTQIASYEVPLATVSGVQPNLLPVELRSHLVILNMSFDGSGRITDYAMADPACQFTAGLQTHPASITFPSFSTVFGGTQPISGDIQIKFEPIAFRQ
jgi:hypothetical protein